MNSLEQKLKEYKDKLNYLGYENKISDSVVNKYLEILNNSFHRKDFMLNSLSIYTKTIDKTYKKVSINFNYVFQNYEIIFNIDDSNKITMIFSWYGDEIIKQFTFIYRDTQDIINRLETIIELVE